MKLSGLDRAWHRNRAQTPKIRPVSGRGGQEARATAGRARLILWGLTPESAGGRVMAVPLAMKFRPILSAALASQDMTSYGRPKRAMAGWPDNGTW